MAARSKPPIASRQPVAKSAPVMKRLLRADDAFSRSMVAIRTDSDMLGVSSSSVPVRCLRVSARARAARFAAASGVGAAVGGVGRCVGVGVGVLVGAGVGIGVGIGVGRGVVVVMVLSHGTSPESCRQRTMICVGLNARPSRKCHPDATFCGALAVLLATHVYGAALRSWPKAQLFRTRNRNTARSALGVRSIM